MPRLPRLHVPGACYHVILRGNHREDLFGAPHDRVQLNENVAESLTALNARLHAFCWMTNHLHALVQIGEAPLGRLMQRVAVGYSRYRHRQLRTRGHLFERRYRAWLVDADAYFVALLRYIHLNPVRAGMVANAQEYEWSSHRAYLGEVTMPWLHVEFGLSLFGSTLIQARTAYRAIMAQDLYASEERLFDEVHPDDARVLGGDRFLAGLSLPQWTPRSPLTLSDLAEQICQRHGVIIEAVCSASREHILTAIRAEIASRALSGRVASLSEVARFLGRSPSSLCGLLKRHSSA